MKKQFLAAALVGAISLGSSLVGMESIASVCETINSKDADRVLKLMENLTKYDNVGKVAIENFELADRCRIIKALLVNFVAKLEQAPKEDSSLDKLINWYILNNYAASTGYLAMGNGDQTDAKDNERLALKIFYFLELIRIADSLPQVKAVQPKDYLTTKIATILDHIYVINIKGLDQDQQAQQKISKLMRPIFEKNLESLLALLLKTNLEEKHDENYLKEIFVHKYAKDIMTLLSDLVSCSFFMQNYTKNFGLSFS